MSDGLQNSRLIVFDSDRAAEIVSDLCIVLAQELVVELGHDWNDPATRAAATRAMARATTAMQVDDGGGS